MLDLVEELGGIFFFSSSSTTFPKVSPNNNSLSSSFQPGRRKNLSSSIVFLGGLGFESGGNICKGWIEGRSVLSGGGGGSFLLQNTASHYPLLSTKDQFRTIVPDGDLEIEAGLFFIFSKSHF